MRLLLSVEHPAWVHQFRYVIKELEKKGHEIKVVAIRKDVTCDLLDSFNIPYEIISDTSGIGTIEKGIIFLKTTFKIFQISRQFKPDMFIGRASPMMAINSFLFQKPHILFEDSEPSHFCLMVCELFSSVIFTPNCFKKNLGKKQIRIPANKEIFYLHPSYFIPNPDILAEMNLNLETKYCVVRFVAWNAHHDIGMHGIEDKMNFIKILESEGILVLISSETELPQILKNNQIKITPEKIHDVLYYSTLFVSDSQTMTTEAGLLGTPAVRCNTFVGSNDMGNFVELEEKYGLIYNFFEEEEAIAKARDLISENALKDIWRVKKEKFFLEKIDATAFLVWFIDTYPESVSELKEFPDILNRFASVPE